MLLNLAVSILMFYACVPTPGGGGGTPNNPDIVDFIPTPDTAFFNESIYIGTDSLRVDVDQDGDIDIYIYSANLQHYPVSPLINKIELWVPVFKNTFQGCLSSKVISSDSVTADSYFSRYKVFANTTYDSIGVDDAGHESNNAVLSSPPYTSEDFNTYNHHWFQATISNVGGASGNALQDEHNYLLRCQFSGRGFDQYPNTLTSGWLPFRFIKDGETDYRYGYVELNYNINDDSTLPHFVTVKSIAYGLPSMKIRIGAK